MNSRVLSYVTVVVCLLLGATLIGMRYQARKTAQIAQEDSLWTLTYVVEFEPVEKDAEVFLYIPHETPHCQVQVEKPSHIGLRSERRGGSLVATAPTTGGPYQINAEFGLRLSPRADMSRTPAMEYLSPNDRARYLRDDEDQTIPTDSPVVREMAAQARDQGETISERVQWIFRTCSEIGAPGEATADDPQQILSANTPPTALGRARTMVALSRAVGVPARLVTGFEIKQALDSKPQVWVEVFMGQTWVPFDPTNGFTRYLPMNFVPVRKGGDSPVRARGGTIRSARYSIQRNEPPQSVLQAEQRHPIQILDLSRLPLPMHKVMSILLLLPFGALITAIVRNVVGIGTFGTFSPTLLAMSFIYANWETGVAILIIVMLAGLLSRAYLERLRLLAVPRLSIILTVVILCVVFGVSILHYVLPEISTDAVLLPMVILTMLIERFYVSNEEDGLVYTLQLATGTLVVAAICYAILAWTEVGQFVVVYPEIHFFTIAVFILLGRYAGYRITELWRFRDLVTSAETP